MKRRFVFGVLLCAWLTLAVAGCGVAQRSLRGSGVTVKESRSVSGFQAVSLNGIGTVRLEQSGAESLTVEAEDNIAPLLTTTVEGGTLKIGVKPHVNVRPTVPVIFHVTAARIDSLNIGGSGRVESGALKAPGTFTARISGSGDMKLERIEAERVTCRVSGSGGVSIGQVDARQLKCEIAGSGNGRLAGKVHEAELGISGSGSYRAEGLACHTADVSISGSGSASIGRVEQRLNADISGSGSLRFRGQPPVLETHVSGSGSVSRSPDAG